MNYWEFLEKTVDQGIAAVKHDYASPDQKLQRDGSIAGFEACRSKNPVELKELLDAAHTATQDAYCNDREDYWWYRCYQLEVEWTCNVVSAVLHNQGLPVIIPPTARGVIQAGKIAGVKDDAG